MAKRPFPRFKVPYFHFARDENRLMLHLKRRVHQTLQPDERAQAAWAASVGNRLAAKIASIMKIKHDHDLRPENGGSDCVGASALSAGIFMKTWAIKTKTLT